MRKTALVSAICLFALSSIPARAVVVVLGDGLGQECYATAEFGEVNKAFDACSAALENTSMKVRDRAATYINRSVIRLRVRDYEGAVNDTTLSIALQPGISEAYVNRGAALLNLDRPKEALVDLNKAITMGLDKIHLAYFNRALTKERLNDVPGAYADYKKAFEIDPSFTDAQDELKRFKVINGVMTMSERS